MKSQDVAKGVTLQPGEPSGRPPGGCLVGLGSWGLEHGGA